MKRENASASRLNKFMRFTKIAIAFLLVMSTPHAQSTKLHPLTPVPNQSVTINDKFWSPKLNVWRKVTINDAFDKYEHTGALANFDRVATQQKSGHKGEPWWDGLVYEMITASADFLANHSDAALQKRVEGYIERIGAAAAVDPDGYINTGVTLDNIGFRWSNPPAPGDDHNDNWPHTIYNAGCLVEAGVHWYRATGQTRLLQIATRLANYMCGVMGPTPKQNIIPGHALPEQAFIELYRLYREQPALKKQIGAPVNENAYLQLAEFWIEKRGQTEGRKSEGVYNQDDKSVFAQPALQGHAVRSGLLASGIATAAVVNRRPEYLQTGARWWQNMVEGKMYITGGLGAIPSFEGFGADYDLPNRGYAETCAAVAGGFFSHRMNLATADAKYVDILERELYNGALSGVSLAGDRYFYTNYLESGPDHRRWEWNGGAYNGTPCCPPMFLKLQGAMPSYIYATDASGIYVNLYIGSQAQTQMGKLPVTLQQVTNYPWDETVQLTLTPQKAARFALHLRIPAWARQPVIKINGKTIPFQIVDYYALLKRTWKKGDVVTLRLPMPIERSKADPRVTANQGRVALMRGPIVYCLEGIDNSGKVNSLMITPDAALTAQFRPGLLGGVTVLQGTAQRARQDGDQVQFTPVQFTAIPFYANSNREPADMAVWIADNATQVQPLTPAGEATPSASHCNPSDTLAALNDSVLPAKSDDENLTRMTWWDHRGTAEWVQYDFKTPRRISGVEVYWWDERRINRQCRVPQSWEVQYLDNGQWKPVMGASPYGTQMDAFNRVAFKPITTKALRLAVQLQPEWSAGILEWRVLEAK